MSSSVKTPAREPTGASSDVPDRAARSSSSKSPTFATRYRGVMQPPPRPSRHDVADEVSRSLLGRGRSGVLLLGSAGIGKTHLLGRVGEVLESSGVIPVPVTGTAAGSGIPLGSFATVMTSAGFALSGAAPTMALIRHLGAQRSKPGLLVDNVDRLDAASLFVVQHCVRDLRLPVVLTVRSFDLLPDAMHELYDAGVVRALEIEPLSHPESLAVATDALGGRLTPRASSLLLELSGGNPLHVRELVIGSRESGSLVATEHGWDFRERPHATPRLAQLIGAVFDALDEDAVDLAGLLTVSDGIPADLLDDRLVRAVIRRGVAEFDGRGVVRLAHPLFGEAIMSRSPAALLDLYRERALDLLLGADAERRDPVARARLIDLAVAVGRPVATENLIEEAQRAQGVMDHDLAARLSRLALDADPDHPVATRIAGVAASGRGDAEAESLLRHALDLAPDEASHGRAARSLAHHLAVRQHEPLRAADLIGTVLLSVGDPAERSRLEHDLLQWQMVGGTIGVIPPPPHASHGASYAHHLAVSLMVSLIVGPLEEAEATSRRLDENMPVYRDEVPMGPAIAQLGRFMIIAYRGDILSARETALRALRLDHEQPEMRGAWEYSLGMIELLSGDVGEAARLAADAAGHLRWRDPLGLLPAALALGEAASVALGDDITAYALAAQIPEPMLADPKAAMLRAWAAAWRERSAGRPGRAADIILDAARQLHQLRHVFLAAMLAHCASRVGHADRAVPVLETLVDGGGVTVTFLAYARALADGDTTALAELVDQFQTSGMASGSIDAMTRLARWARDRGDIMSARRWEWRAAELVATNPPMALWSHGGSDAASLSAREREVALLAAERLSAREIGERLGSSAKTVTNQLASVYRKLGVSGRAELRELVDDPGARIGSGP